MGLGFKVPCVGSSSLLRIVGGKRLFRWPKEGNLSWSHIPPIAVVSYTLNIRQTDIGIYSKVSC